MGDSIFHRGPDDAGYYSDGFVNLCSRRLSIVDLDAGKQPIHNEDGSLWVVCNGEIYNHEALRKELIGKGHRFYTDHSDTEVILHLYEEYGLDFLHYLNGMFAIAIWDSRKKELLLFRDRMGVKPLFYALVNGELVFSSEIKSILNYPAFQKQINYDALYHYFSFKNIVPPQTAFEGVYEILPGHYGIWKEKKLRLSRYWKIDFSRPSNDSFEEAKEKIKTLLVDATLIRIPKDVGMGAFLSGGLDSSLITAIIAKNRGGNFDTFSLCYSGKDKSVYKKGLDQKYAAHISRMYGTKHHQYFLSSEEVIKTLPDVIQSFDQPFSGVTSTYFLSREISKHAKVAFSGDGADELFGSYLLHRLAFPFSHFAQQRRVSAKESICASDEVLRHYTFSPDYLENLYEKTKGSFQALSCELLQIGDNEKSVLLSEDFKAQLRQECSTKEIINVRYKTTTASDPLNTVLEYDWNNLLVNQILAFADFLSMAHGLEIRSPFLDYRLVEYVASLPGDYRHHEAYFEGSCT